VASLDVPLDLCPVSPNGLVKGWWMGRGTARILRTTQWTRASTSSQIETRLPLGVLVSLVRVLFVSMTFRTFRGSGKALVFLQFC
jgi:hypothetical protein